MKWMIASDIHGSAYWCAKLLEEFEKEGADRLILLGDLLYHGPRNALPQDYDGQAVAAMLNARRDRIMAVRGNCDAEIDQMLLDFPIMADYAMLPVGERLMFITHGHLFNSDSLPPLCSGDILLNGHFHVPACEERENHVYLNPGSVSIPKEGSANGYMLLEDGVFRWMAIGGGEYMRWDANK